MMNMSIGKKTMYVLGGFAAALIMNASLSSCAKQQQKQESNKNKQTELLDSMRTDTKLLNLGFPYDPSRSYAEAKIKLDSALRAKFPEAKNLEEAMEMDDSVNLAKICSLLGVPVPKKPSADASQDEKLEYEYKILTILLNASSKIDRGETEQIDRNLANIAKKLEKLKVTNPATKEYQQDILNNLNMLNKIND